jgi:hypothetical protein
VAQSTPDEAEPLVLTQAGDDATVCRDCRRPISSDAARRTGYGGRCRRKHVVGRLQRGAGPRRPGAQSPFAVSQEPLPLRAPVLLITVERRSTMSETQRVPVRVLLLVGDQAELTTPERDHRDPERVPAERITRDTGIPAAELPGAALTAVVEGGELARFERA